MIGAVFDAWYLLYYFYTLRQLNFSLLSWRVYYKSYKCRNSWNSCFCSLSVISFLMITRMKRAVNLTGTRVKGHIECQPFEGRASKGGPIREDLSEGPQRGVGRGCVRS